jgi:hypothetical protein
MAFAMLGSLVSTAVTHWQAEKAQGLAEYTKTLTGMHFAFEQLMQSIDSYAEHLRDMTEINNKEYDTFLVVNTLLIGCTVTMVVEGRLQDQDGRPNTIWAVLVIYYVLLIYGFIMLFTSMVAAAKATDVNRRQSRALLRLTLDLRKKLLTGFKNDLVVLDNMQKPEQLCDFLKCASGLTEQAAQIRITSKANTIIDGMDILQADKAEWKDFCDVPNPAAGRAPIPQDGSQSQMILNGDQNKLEVFGHRFSIRWVMRISCILGVFCIWVAAMIFVTTQLWNLQKPTSNSGNGLFNWILLVWVVLTNLGVFYFMFRLWCLESTRSTALAIGRNDGLWHFDLIFRILQTGTAIRGYLRPRHLWAVVIFAVAFPTALIWTGRSTPAHMPTHTYAEFVQAAKLMHEVDGTRNGKVDLAEATKLHLRGGVTGGNGNASMSGVGNSTGVCTDLQNQIARLFFAHDTNSDYELDMREFASYLIAYKEMQQGYLKACSVQPQTAHEL